MLRKIRIIFATIFFVLISLLFFDFTGITYQFFGWLPEIQLIPALMALNLSIIIGLIILTLIFGRIYCSLICPLGFLQDIISWFRRKKNKYSYSKPVNFLRYGILIVFSFSIIWGVVAVVSLLSPYSSFGRIAFNLFTPIYRQINNFFVFWAEKGDSYFFYTVDVGFKAGVTFFVALATFIVLIVLSWSKGRIYCNILCPVGTILGFFSKFSLFKPIIDFDKCNGCGLCSMNCKSSCINIKNREIDYSLCVVCLDCVDKCNNGAMKYSIKRKNSKEQESNIKENELDGKITGRRKILSIMALFTLRGLLISSDKEVDGGLAEIKKKKKTKRETPVLPPGSESAKKFNMHCTGCQLCVSACTNQVLFPSDSLKTFMQPEMSYEKGYCRPECVRCSEVCPTDAIKIITTSQKSSIQIGHAVWKEEICIVNRDNVSCISCFRHCPVGAIQLVNRDKNNPKSLKIPTIDTERCIGCGACENLCPSRPFSAIYVEGHKRHRVI